MRSRRACSFSTRPRPPPVEIMGVLSLIFWSLIIIVTVKYVFLVMRADNRGEGGILALMALAQRVSVGRGRQKRDRPGRHRRRLPVLRRRRDHAGDLGAVGGRGAGGFRARSCKLYVLPISVVGDRRPCSPCNIRAPAASAGCSGRSWCVWFLVIGADRADRDHPASARADGGFADLCVRNCAFSTRVWRSSCSAPWCCASPGPRRCMPIWGISAPGRSASPG